MAYKTLFYSYLIDNMYGGNSKAFFIFIIALFLFYFDLSFLILFVFNNNYVDFNSLSIF